MPMRWDVLHNGYCKMLLWRSINTACSWWHTLTVTVKVISNEKIKAEVMQERKNRENSQWVSGKSTKLSTQDVSPQCKRPGKSTRQWWQFGFFYVISQHNIIFIRLTQMPNCVPHLYLSICADRSMLIRCKCCTFTGHSASVNICYWLIIIKYLKTCLLCCALFDFLHKLKPTKQETSKAGEEKTFSHQF